MGIGKKFKDTWKKLTGKSDKTTKAQKSANDMTDSELALEEVVEQEIFPEGKRPVKRKVNSHYRVSDDCVKGKSAKNSKSTGTKPPSKRTRPTNSNYKMINPDDDTADAGKS